MSMKYISLLALVVANLSYGNSNVESAKKFHSWLGQNESYFTSCEPKKNNDHYRLCDGTLVSQKKIIKLFSLTSKELIDEIKSEGIKIEVYCKAGVKKTFKTCLENIEREGFKKNKDLEGQYKPLENTILLRSHANRGSLIHEYIHYLQYKNTKKVRGKRYKYERVQVEKALVDRMDEIISTVQSLEKKGVSKKQLSHYMEEMILVSTQLKNFAKWQDLIDERNIFLLYKNFGSEFGVRSEDLSLVNKNLNFLCNNPEYKSLKGKKECYKLKPEKVDYKAAVLEVIEELRPKKEVSKSKEIINAFYDGVPVNKEKSLKGKIRNISNYIFREYKVVSDNSISSRKDKDNILPDTVITGRHGHCVGLSTLYLLAAQKINVEAYLVRIPEHVFVRFCQGAECVDVETLRAGELVSKEFYVSNGYMSDKQIEGTSYYTSLKGAKKLKSSLYLSLGYIANESKQYGLSELLYKKSIDNDRSFADGYLNLASVYSLTGQTRQARTYLNIAQKINPKHLPTMINTSALEWRAGNKKKALSILLKAQEINPFDIKIYKMRADFMKLDKNSRKEFENLLMVSNIKPKSCWSHKRALEVSKSLKVIKFKKELSYLEDAQVKHCNKSDKK